MRAIVVHSALLAVALILAFVTWTREDRPDTGEATIEVWDHDPADLLAVVYRSDDRLLELERRSSNGEDYLWATETAPDPMAAAAAADTATDDPATSDTTAAAAPTDTVTDTAATADTTPAPAAPPPMRVEQFPVGESGTVAMEDLAQLHALRDLGRVDAEQRTAYGLDDPEATLTLRFRDGAERQLALGQSIVGGGHRYVLDTEADRVYVVTASLLRPIESGASMLRLTQVHTFEPEDVASATIRSESAERTMQRRTSGSPPQPVWTPPDSDRPDQTFANFMEQLDRLWVARYDPDLVTDTLQRILRADYFGARGDTIGTLELFRTRGADSTAYWVRTRRTIVPGEVYAPFAERIEQDVETLFSGAPRPVASHPN